MNYIKHLSGFFDKTVNDTSLNPTHISLYIGLFQFWNINRFINPISINRDEIMRISKIYSKATYHKCIKDLDEKGFIVYQPSFNPYKGSLISICDLSIELKLQQKRANSKPNKTPDEEHILNNSMNNSMNKHRTSSETGTEQVTEQALVPSINYINKTNKINISNIENLSEQKKIENQNEKFFEKNDFDLKNHLIDSEKEKKEMLFAFADTEKNQTESGRQKSSAKKEKNIHAEISSELEKTNFQKSNFQFVNFSGVENFDEKEKSSAKKEKNIHAVISSELEKTNFQKSNFQSVISSGVEHPTLPEVKHFFSEKNFPEIEAQKFFNYFSSNGWLVGGRAPMVNWKAAAENWVLNSIYFSQNEPQAPKNNYLSTTTLKDYSEPL